MENNFPEGRVWRQENIRHICRLKCPMGLKLRLWTFVVIFGNKVLDQNYNLTN